MAALAMGTHWRDPIPSDLQNLVDHLLIEVLDDHIQEPNMSHLSAIQSLVKEVVVNTLDSLVTAYDLCWEYDTAARCAVLTAGVSE